MAPTPQDEQPDPFEHETIDEMMERFRLLSAEQAKIAPEGILKRALEKCAIDPWGRNDLQSQTKETDQ